MIDSTPITQFHTHLSCRGPVLASLLTGALLAGGCTIYRDQPLNAAAVETSLKAPDVAAVKVAAAAITHPLLAPIRIDGRDGFTPDEVAVMTVITSPRLRALRDQRGVARAQVIQAGLLPNPQLGYTFDRPTDPSLVNAINLGLSWDLSSLLSYRDRLAAAQSTASALDLDIAWQEWQAAQDARLAAFRVLSLEARLVIAREIEVDQAEALALTQKAQALGLRTTADVVAASEAWSLTQDARFALEQERDAQMLRLKLALGLPAETTLKLKAGPDATLLTTETENAASFLDGIEKRRLDLIALTLGYESAAASLRAAVKSQFPRIGISLSKARDTSDIHTRGYGVTVDLPLFDHNQGQIAATAASRQQLFDEYLSRVAEAKAEVLQILINLHVLRTQLRTLEAELPEREQLARALDQAMQTRNADAQNARDARSALLTSRAERAKMRQDILELCVALEIATGQPLLVRSSTN